MAQQATDPIVTAIKDFQNALNPAQQAELLAIHGASPPDVTAVLAFTAEVDRTTQRRNSRCVASRLHGTLQSVQQFTNVVGTFVSSNPAIAALVWGSIRFTILAASNFTSFFEKLSELFMKIQAYCPRFSEYQHLHAGSQRLQGALCVYFATVVQFCTKAVEVISRSGYLQALKSLWMPFDREFGDFAARLQQQSKQVSEEVRLASEQAADRERQLQVAERKDAARARKIGKLVRSQISSLSAEDRAWRVQTQLRETLVQKQKLLDALSTYDYHEPLRRERKRRYGRTGLWLSECKEYQDWLHDDRFGAFWLSGILGSGKTVLTTAVIDDLLNQPSQKRLHVAFFLCQYDNAASLQARTILGCLLRQFLTVESMSEAVENLLLQLSKGKSSDSEALNPLFSEILDSAREDNPVIVIDGFDEVPRSERDVLLSILGQTCSFTRSCIKILVSSRQDIRRELETTFPDQYTRTMSCLEVCEDITTYIDLSIEDKLFRGDLVVGDANLVHDIKNALISRSNGMFLWVSFQIEDICAQHSDEAIQRVIGSLPRDLPATYHRALERVVRNHKAEVARKMFRWVAAAKRPLSLMEIREAIAVEPCQPSSQQDKLVNDVYQIVPWCGNLLVLDEEEGLVQFAHHSVKDYLLSAKAPEIAHHSVKDYLLSAEAPEISSHHFGINLRDVDREAGEICCTYLHFSDFERQIIHLPQVSSGLDPKAIVKTSLSASSNPTMTSSLLRLNALRKVGRATETSEIWRQLHLTSLKVGKMWPQDLQTRYYFLAYASEYWLDHTNGFNENDQCWGLFRRLVLTENTTLATRPWSIEEWKAFGAKVQDTILKTEHRALLRLANLEQLLHARADLCRVIDGKYSPLCSDELFQFHINATKLVEDFWATWDPVLIIAADRCRLDWVKQVLESILAQNKTKNSNAARPLMDASLAQIWDSAWQQAERQGTWEMLDLLLTYKAIILGKLTERGYKELNAAALTGNLELTRRLLDARVDPNVVPSRQSSSSGSILTAAASRGFLEVVEHLLYAGAEVNLSTGLLRETPLYAAAKRGRTLIVMTLLAAGADLGARFRNCNMVELAAAGHDDVMVLLLLLAGTKFRAFRGYHQAYAWVDLTEKETITGTKWFLYALATDPTLKYYSVHSSFPPKSKDFFHALKDHVKNSCGNDLGLIKVEKAVESFLQRILKLEQDVGEVRSVGGIWQMKRSMKGIGIYGSAY